MVLVTGGTGLVGSHLLYHLLSSGYRVRAIKRKESNLTHVRRVFSYYSPRAAELAASIEWVDADVLDIFSLMDAMEGVRNVFHCAALVSFVAAEGKLMLKTNVEGTANVMNAALEKKVKKVCHVSSIAALGFQRDCETDEEHFWKSSPHNSIYSISKYGAEREAWRAMEEGMDVVVMNPSLIIGPGFWHKNGSGLIDRAYKKLNYYPEGSIGFVDVRDVVRGMVALMDSDIKNERFILNSENCTYKRFLDLVHDQFGHPRPSIRVGRFLSGLAWRYETIKGFFTGTAPALTKEIARTVCQQNYFSNKKIRTATGMEFIPIEQSIRDTCKLYLRDLKTADVFSPATEALVECKEL